MGLTVRCTEFMEVSDIFTSHKSKPVLRQIHKLLIGANVLVLGACLVVSGFSVQGHAYAADEEDMELALAIAEPKDIPVSELSASDITLAQQVTLEDVQNTQQRKIEQQRDAYLAQLPSSYTDMFRLNLESSSGIEPEFWEYWLSSPYKELSSELQKFDEVGINAAFIVAVMYAECGRDAHVVGANNVFNFTVDMKAYSHFSSKTACLKYAREWFQKSFFNRDWHCTRANCQLSSHASITIERVNEHYAINSDGSVNWQWSSTVASVMTQIYSDYVMWYKENM